MKRIFVFILLLISLSAFGKSLSYRVAVLDFTVSTTNEKHRYIGKGLAEIFSFELGSDEAITLIDRKARNEAMEEINLSLTGLVNEESVLQVGEVLTAQYLVTGNLVEMDRRYLISLNALNVETGELIWQDQLLTVLRNYDGISTYFAQSFTGVMLGDDAPTTSVEAEIDEDDPSIYGRKAEALIAFSSAVDAIDSGDEDLARTELGKAKAADPGSRVVDYYIALLSVVSPRFKFELRPFGPSYNPAYLPRMSADKFYIWESLPFAFLQAKTNKQITSEISTYETEVVINAGYLAPFGERHGFDVSASWSTVLNNSSTTVPYTFRSSSDTSFQFGSDNWSLSLGYAFAVSGTWSIGLSFQPIVVVWTDPLSSYSGSTFQFTVTAGSLATFLQRRLLWDAQITYSYFPQFYAIEADQEFYEGWVPLVVETTVIGTAIPDTLYCSLKALFDIYLDDRGGVFAEIVPTVEYRPAQFLALKAGYQFSFLSQLSRTVVGHGVNAGLILNFGKWEFDAAYSYANAPLANVPGYVLPLSKLHFGLTRSGNFIVR